MNTPALRALFWLVAAAAAASIWLAPHPPMIDLPQHAGQLALLKQFVSGHGSGAGRWTALFQIDPFTPYLIGFALALPLSFLMPIAAALKLMLTLVFMAFVAACVALRKHFGADARLDWLLLCPFFGYAFHWGFFTFLTAAPLGLLLVLLADRHAMAPTLRRGAVLAATGLLLLVSHGLIFLYALALSAALTWVRAGTLRRAVARAWPLAVMAVGLVAYFLARGPAEAAFEVPKTVPRVMWHLGLRHEVLSYVFDARSRPALHAVTLALLAAPWLMGLRIDWRKPAALVPFAVTATLLSLAPSFVFETSFVYERFALFLLPTYAWMFAAAQPAAATPAAASGPAARSASRPLATATAAVMALLCSTMLAVNAWQFWRFGQEAGDFDRLAAQAAPGKRALAMVFDPVSPAMAGNAVYGHYASWYQVEHEGLVDFNFAWVQPQIVRYRVATRPPVALDFPWHPGRFNWQGHQGERYDYFFVRGELPAATFDGAPCKPRLVQQQGHWQLFAKVGCP